MMPLAANAESLAEALNLPDNVWVGGRLTQGTGVYFDRYGGGTGVGPSQFVAQLQAEWTPNSNVTVVSDFWLRGDWYYDLDDGDSTGPGTQDFTKGPPFLDRFDFYSRRMGRSRFLNRLVIAVKKIAYSMISSRM